MIGVAVDTKKCKNYWATAVLVSRVSPQASENNFVRRVPIHNDSRYLVLAGKGNQKCYESPLRKCYERSPSHQT